MRLLAIPCSVNKRLACPRERRGILWSCSPSKWESSRFVFLLKTLTFIVLYNCSNNVHFYLVNWNIPSGSNFLCCDLKIHMVLCYWERVLQRFFFMYDYASNLRLYLHEISIISATMTPIDYHLTEQCSWCVPFLYGRGYIWDLVKSLKALISTLSSII